MKEKLTLASYVRGTTNRRDDFVSIQFSRRLEDTAYNAFLPPSFTGRKFSIRDKASQLGACTRATGRPVVRSPRAEHEIARIRGRIVGWRKKLDVVDFAAIRPGHTFTIEG